MLAAGVLALGTGAGHLVLSVVNLIPGEPTAGLAFAGMGIGYVIAAALVLLRKSLFYTLTLFYTIALLLAYVVTRDSLPVEPIGLGIKANEVGLTAVVLALLRKSASR